MPHAQHDSDSATSGIQPAYYTRAQVMHRLGIGETKLHEILKSGELASVQIGRSRKIPRDALATFEAKLVEEGSR
jgi:excisionase family DNA binding protein